MTYSCIPEALALPSIFLCLILIFTFLAYFYGKQKGYEMYREDLRELKRRVEK